MEDLGARNTTRLDGRAITVPTRLSNGNVLQIGETRAFVELLVSLGSVAGLRIRNIALAADAARRLALEHELDTARRIQQSLLPDAVPEIEGYALVAESHPSRTVSGDLFEVRARETGEVVLLVADVSGKGMAASLLTASLEALAAGPIEVGLPPHEMCERLSRRLYARTPPERFATAFVGSLEPSTGRIAWANGWSV